MTVLTVGVHALHGQPTHQIVCAKVIRHNGTMVHSPHIQFYWLPTGSAWEFVTPSNY